MEINGLSYHLTESGDGPETVLFLHGMPDTAAAWRHQMRALSERGYRVVAPDMLGYGRTDKPAELDRYQGERVVEDMVILLESLGPNPVHVVGHDWGAFVSWELAIHRPDLVGRHVALSVGHPAVFFGDLSVEGLKANWYMYLNALPGAAELYARDDGRFLRTRLMATHPEIDEVCARVSDPEAMRGMLNWDRANPLAALYDATLRGDYAPPRCPTPTLGIWSSDDIYLTEDQVTASAEHMDAEWRYERVDGASHWTMLDQPERVNELILDWLVARG